MVGRWLRSQLLLAIVVIVQCSTTIEVSKCTGRREYDFVDGNCIYVSPPYSLLLGPTTFDNAVAACQARNGNSSLTWSLVKVDTRRKHDRICAIDVVQRSGNTPIWIGLIRDKATSEKEKGAEQWRNWKKWRWVRDRSTLDASFVGETAPWKIHEPNNYRKDDERCGVLHGSLKVWSDYPCNRHFFYLCESFDMSTATSPDSTSSTIAIETTTAEETTTITRGGTTGAVATTPNPDKSMWLGIAIGAAGLILLILIIAGLVYYVRSRRRKVIYEEDDPMFSAMTDQSGAFENVRENSMKSKKSVRSPKSPNSSKSSKRQPSSRKGPSSTLKRLFERWAAVDAKQVGAADVKVPKSRKSRKSTSSPKSTTSKSISVASSKKSGKKAMMKS